MGIRVYTVLYHSVDNGNFVSVYNTESLAYQGALKMIADELYLLDNHESYQDLVNLINEKAYKKALSLWQSMMYDTDSWDEISVDETEIVTKVEPLEPILSNEEDS